MSTESELQQRFEQCGNVRFAIERPEGGNRAGRAVVDQALEVLADGQVVRGAKVAWKPTALLTQLTPQLVFESVLVRVVARTTGHGRSGDRRNKKPSADAAAG